MEHLNQPTPENKPVGAQEVLVSEAQLTEKIGEVIDDGQIKIEPFIESETYKRPDVYVGVKADKDEIVLKNEAHFLSDGSGYFDATEFDWKNKEGALKEAELIRKKAINKVGLDIAPWYLNDELLSGKVDKNEPLSQAFELSVGDAKLQLLNFSTEHVVADEHVELLRKTLLNVVTAAGAGIMESVAGVAFVDHKDLNGENRYDAYGGAIGLFKNYNGALFLSDRLLWDSDLDSDKYKLDEDRSRLETTFAHELGHAAQNFNWSTYEKALGWQRRSYEVVDDFGNVVKGNIHTLGAPGEVQKVFKDGSIQEVPTKEHFDEQAIRSMKPNTSYGSTQAPEDFAEASVPFFLDGRNTDKIDPIRLEAISSTIHEKYADRNVVNGPYIVEARELSFGDLRQQAEAITVPPQTLTVKVSASVETAEKQKYNRYEDIVDDYGNQVKGVRPPAYYE